jgi:hypothetical protein
MKKIALLALGFLLANSIPCPAQQPSPTPVTNERSIYLPYEKLEQVFEREGRGVFLPYREFLEMWNKINLPDAAKNSQPPVDGILASAHYGGKVSGEVLTLQAKLEFEALKEGWSSLKLGTGDLDITEAKSTATLAVADDGHQIIFPNKGRYTLDMTVLGKITKDAGRSNLKLNLPRTAVSQFEISVPDRGLDFTITPACAFTTSEQPDGTTKLAVYFGASQEINISWQKRGGETALKPLIFAETLADTKISAGAVRTNLTLNCRILRSGVSQFEALIPADQQVLSVDGQNLRDWTLDKSGDRQRLVVNLHTPARDNYTLRVAMESGIATLPAKIDAPLIELKNVERQSGVVSLSHDPELVAEIGSISGLTQQAGGGKSDGTRIGQYRYLRLPYALGINVSSAQPLIEVASETLLTVEPEILTLRANFNYDVKKAGVFSAQIELPEGFERADASGDAVESSSVQKNGDKRVLEIKFNNRRMGAFSFNVTADASRKAPDEALAVPVFKPLGVQKYEGKVGVAVHVSLKASTADNGDLRQEDIRNLDGPSAQIRDAAATPLTLAFRYRGDVKAAHLAFELRKPRVSAEVLALMEVRESLIKNTWWINYNVEYAGVDEFSIAVPKEIADDIQIDGANIKERLKSEDKNLPGQVVWKVSLQDKNLGAYALKISLERPRGQLNAEQTAPVNLPEIKPLGLFRENGQIAVVKDGNLEFTKTDTKGAEFIDPKELHGQLQQNGIFLAYKYAAHPVALNLDVSKNLYLDVPTALVTYAVINSVVAEDRAQTTEVVYWVRNNSQQFFTIRLPENGKMLADVFVNGELQQPSRRPGKNEMLVRLPVQQGSGGTFAVRFVYEVPSANPGSGLWPRGTIRIEPPVLTDAAIMQTQWTLWLPSGYRYVKFSGAMREFVSQRRGWNVFHRIFDRFVPNFGLLNVQQTDTAQEAPKFTAGQNAGVDFQIPREGKSIVLHRLDAPSEVAAAYRSLTYYYTVEAILFFAALYFGIRLTGAARETKFAYAMSFGIGALIIAGAVDPRGAGKWHAIYLGVFLAVLFWIAAELLKKTRRWMRRIRESKSAAPPAPPVFKPAAEPTPEV